MWPDPHRIGQSGALAMEEEYDGGHAPGGGRAVAAALAYDSAGGRAPQVTATGRGALAEQILRIAFDRGVPVRTDGDLAEVLAAVEVDSEIPLQALAAVAEILSYIYRANAATGAGAEGAP